VIPGAPAIDIRTCLDVNTLGETEMQMKPSQKYEQLAQDSATVLGNFVGRTICRMHFPLDNSGLEDLCSSFCIKLNETYDQRISPAVAAHKVTVMLESFIVGVKSLCVFAELQARLTQCLVTRISISRSPKSHSIIDQLLRTCNKNSFSFCARTLEELKDVC
jgi:hypothetical protein